MLSNKCDKTRRFCVNKERQTCSWSWWILALLSDAVRMKSITRVFIILITSEDWHSLIRSVWASLFTNSVRLHLRFRDAWPRGPDGFTGFLWHYFHSSQNNAHNHKASLSPQYYILNKTFLYVSFTTIAFHEALTISFFYLYVFSFSWLHLSVI